MLYTWLKLFHVIAVIIFLGNIFTGLFWMRLAVKTKDVQIIHHSINGVIVSDRYFTIPGVIFITTAGIFAALVGEIPLLSALVNFINQSHHQYVDHQFSLV